MVGPPKGERPIRPWRVGATVVLALVLGVAGLRAEGPAVVVKAGRLWDGLRDTLQTNVWVVIRDGVIREVRTDGRVPSDATVLDLSDATVLPGLIDGHTHIFLQGDPTLASYAEQILQESIPYRTIRAVVAARTALEHGFTTLRDLGTEGAMYADADVKKAIERGVIPGPRLFISTRAISSTGTYPLLGYAWELSLPSGVEVADGPEAIRRAVRTQVAQGADWIKFYADRSYFIGADGRLRSWVNFTDEEMALLVREAHLRGRKVAAHAIGWDGIDAALRAGVDSIEHGDGLTEDLMERMVRQGVYWCPTLTVLLYVAEPRAREGRPVYREMIALQRQAFRQALARGVRIAFGTDAGGFPWNEIHQAREFELMVEYGMTPLQALRSATRVAAEMLGMGSELGAVAPGYRADLIAVPGDPLRDVRVLQQVRWVMKDGRVVYGTPEAGKGR
ncbi:Imidazolonepropionase [bacterium HR11]|nr:Imidazolonepropionase [bacterium HR11]